ncbi:DNA circularization protein [Turicimonas muris]|uniref:DNA circularization protein n=1 Tax=Turicimonas muris TaxID=1796652 RepID=UPI002674C0F8|nr:DNA circularization N-terminal domain-containing protein [Turicimonas muris]
MNAPELRKASFRGVAFEVTSSDFKVGRRTQTFEYPQRDTPFTEDLGRSKRTITMTAYVIGADYITRMKRLIAACEKAGSGRLIHPWLGTMEVVAVDLTSPRFDSNRIATVTLNFVESGKLEFPNSIVDAGGRCLKAAGALVNASFDDFVGNFDISGVQDFVKKAVGENFAGILSDDSMTRIYGAFDLADDLADLANDAITLISGAPSSIAQRIQDFLGIQGMVSTVRAWSDVANRFSLLTKEKSLHSAAPDAVASRTTSARIENANAAVQTLVRQTALANAIVAASEVGGENDRQDASSPAQTAPYDDLIAIRDNILEALDSEMFNTGNDAVYEALNEAHAAVYEAITQRAENQARLVTFTPSAVTPALVLAYDYYGDAEREAEIVGRNKIRHSGFVPAIPLKLLNE